MNDTKTQRLQLLSARLAERVDQFEPGTIASVDELVAWLVHMSKTFTYCIGDLHIYHEGYEGDSLEWIIYNEDGFHVQIYEAAVKVAGGKIDRPWEDVTHWQPLPEPPEQRRMNG